MEPIYEKVAGRLDVHSIHWSSILSGAFVAFGVWLFLYSLGAAIGGASTTSLWTGLYVLLSPVIALFCGGLIVGRSRGAEEGKAGAALHAAVVWGFVTTLAAMTFGSIAAAILSSSSAAVWPSGVIWALPATLLVSLAASILGAEISRPRASRVFRRFSESRGYRESVGADEPHTYRESLPGNRHEVYP